MRVISTSSSLRIIVDSSVSLVILVLVNILASFIPLFAHAHSQCHLIITLNLILPSLRNLLVPSNLRHYRQAVSDRFLKIGLIEPIINSHIANSIPIV